MKIINDKAVFSKIDGTIVVNPDGKAALYKIEDVFSSSAYPVATIGYKSEGIPIVELGDDNNVIKERILNAFHKSLQWDGGEITGIEMDKLEQKITGILKSTKTFSEDDMRKAIDMAYSKGLAKPNSGRLSDTPQVQEQIIQSLKQLAIPDVIELEVERYDEGGFSYEYRIKAGDNNGYTVNY